MSLLTVTTRAEPSLSRALVALESRITRRQQSANADGRKAVEKPGYMRKFKEDYVPAIRRRPAPIFTALPAAQLKHPLFQASGTNDLSTILFEPEVLKRPDIIGKPVEFPFSKKDPFHVFGLQKKMLMEFRLLSKPRTVVRGVTTETVDMLEAAGHGSSLDTRVVLTGRSGCGKSFLLLQAVQHCASQKWIVIYIPRAVGLVNSTTSYTYDIRTQTYLQPAFAFQVLQRMLTVNAEALSSVQLQKNLVLERQEVPAGTSLSDLINIAILERSRTLAQSPLILETVMKTLEKQTQHPVLFAVDDFQALYHKTKYRDPHYTPINSYHLSMPRLIMEYASGKRSFAKGAFMGAITSSDTMFTLPLELRDTLKLDYDHPMSPYDKRSPVLLEYTQGLKALPVPEKLTLEEATSLMSIWKSENVLVGANYDEQLLAKYTESGGNPRDFVWKGILSSFTSLECPPTEWVSTPIAPPAAEEKVQSDKDTKVRPGGRTQPWLSTPIAPSAAGEKVQSDKDTKVRLGGRTQPWW